MSKKQYHKAASTASKYKLSAIPTAVEMVDTGV